MNEIDKQGALKYQRLIQDLMDYKMTAKAFVQQFLSFRREDENYMKNLYDRRLSNIITEIFYYADFHCDDPELANYDKSDPMHDITSEEFYVLVKAEFEILRLFIEENDIHNLLRIGLPMFEDMGVNNWALTKSQVLSILPKLAAQRVPILGGDVVEMGANGLFYTYSNWYSDHATHEIYYDYVTRSIAETSNYLHNYPIGEKDIYFALVLG